MQFLEALGRFLIVVWIMSLVVGVIAAVPFIAGGNPIAGRVSAICCVVALAPFVIATLYGIMRYIITGERPT